MQSPETIEVADYLIERLGKSTVTAELIHPDELVSGILSQVAAQPALGDLLAGFMYTSKGQGERACRTDAGIVSAPSNDTGALGLAFRPCACR